MGYRAFTEWTLETYGEIVDVLLRAGYRVSTVDGYLRRPTASVSILRHDVDRFPENALAMARLERAKGISSTYYVRMKPRIFSPALVTELAELGHEVGYHYEVLSDAYGNWPRAAERFEADLDTLRRYVPVTTVAAHGSPLSRWDNREFWRTCPPQHFGLLGDAHIDIDGKEVFYLTDTGRTWLDRGANLRDRYGVGSRPTEVASADDLLRAIADRVHSRLYLQTHPERWCHSLPTFVRSLGFDLSANSVKRFIGLMRSTGRRT